MKTLFDDRQQRVGESNVAQPDATLPGLQGFDLPVIQLDRSTASKNIDDDGNSSIRFVDSVDIPFEALEVPFLHSNAFA